MAVNRRGRERGPDHGRSSRLAPPESVRVRLRSRTGGIRAVAEESSSINLHRMAGMNTGEGEGVAAAGGGSAGGAVGTAARRLLVVNADDLGLSAGVNRGIFE